MTRRLVVHSVALWVALLALTWVVDVDGGVYDADDGAFGAFDDGATENNRGARISRRV